MNPHIKLAAPGAIRGLGCPVWICSGEGRDGYGTSPADAYRTWETLLRWYKAKGVI